MRRSAWGGVVIAVLGCLAAGPAAVAHDGEMVDNPDYAGWAKYKPGTSVTYAQEFSGVGGTHSMSMSRTLTAITPEGATVAVKMSITMNGTTQDMPARTTMVPAKVAKSMAPDQPTAGDPPPEKGTDDLQVAGKTLSCKWMKLTHSAGGHEMTMKFWRSEDVPGGLVKMETRLADGSTMMQTVTAWDVK